MKINKNTDALLVVDVQNSFITGSLAVPDAEEIIPVITELEPKFDTIIYSRDAHISKHPSFQDQGGPWPDHCIIGTYGYRLHSSLMYSNAVPVIADKGLEEEAYSAFTGTIVIQRSDEPADYIEDLLDMRNIKRLFICGLATDYCVKATVLDALKLFNGGVFVLLDAVKAVNINKGDGDKALKEMAEAGATIVISDYLED
jgi:nicotinamidase/pyrazinamidase